jgi:PTH1 family peptidyl-tRNA hydrolase
MILVVGLGNPGKRYSLSKHNIGFMVVDELAKRLGVSLDRIDSMSLCGDTVFEEEKIVFLKPQTYMNLSGKAVSEFVNFYKIPPGNVISVYDEMDLPLGTLKIKLGGGSAGHKGIESIITALGNDGFVRVRVGIGKPGQRSETVNHVLSSFNKGETKLMEEALSRAADAVLEIATRGVESAMNKFNRKPDTLN